jgi:hypothetical protein
LFIQVSDFWEGLVCRTVTLRSTIFDGGYEIEIN